MECFTQIQNGDSDTVHHCLELFLVSKFMDKLAFTTPGHMWPVNEIHRRRHVVWISS